MLRAYLAIAAVALTPALALAQSAVPNPSVPGSGYQIQPAPVANPQSLAADPVNPAVPGDGYKIKDAPRTNPNPPAAEPGDGYQMRTQSDTDHANSK